MIIDKFARLRSKRGCFSPNVSDAYLVKRSLFRHNPNCAARRFEQISLGRTFHENPNIRIAYRLGLCFGHVIVSGFSPKPK